MFGGNRKDPGKLKPKTSKPAAPAQPAKAQPAAAALGFRLATSVGSGSGPGAGEGSIATPSRALEHLAFQLTDPPAAPQKEETSANTAAAAAVAEASPYGVIIEDGLPPGPGQINRSDFIRRVSVVIEQVANEILGPAGRLARDCPYLDFWIKFYARQSAAHIERAIQHYVQPADPTLDGIKEAIVTRVRRAVTAWVERREVQVPEAIDWRVDDDQIKDTAGGGAVAQKMDGGGAGAPAPPGSAAAIRSQLTGGRPLDPAVRSRMERGFGTNFEAVRVHIDSHAAAVARDYRARAFTVGQDVGFGAGQYRPGTIAGDLLLAHELAHTIQQRGAIAEGSGALGLEDDASLAAAGAVLPETMLEPFPRTRGPLSLRRCGTGEEPAPEGVDAVEYRQTVNELRTLYARKQAIESGQPGDLAPVLARIQELRKKLDGWGVQVSEQQLMRAAIQFNPTAAQEYYSHLHYRIIAVQETADFLAGMRKSMLVAANPSASLDDWQQRDGDELIYYEVGVPQMFSLVEDMPNPNDPTLRDTRNTAANERTGTFTAHFMAVGKYTLTAQIRIPTSTVREVKREIQVRAPEFEKESESMVPADLAKTGAARTVDQERLFWHLARSDVRQRAAAAGLIPQNVVDAWTDVSIAVLQRVAFMQRPAQPAGTPPPAPVDMTEITRTLGAFSAAIDGAGAPGSDMATIHLKTAIVRAQGLTVNDPVSQIRTVVDNLSSNFDLWVLGRIEAKSSSDNELYKTLQYGLKSEQEVQTLQARSSVDPVKIPAVFHPKDAYLQTSGVLPASPSSTGRIVELPLNLWLFREGADVWRLRDITNPEKTFEYHTTNSDRDTAVAELVKELREDQEHFPSGRLYIQPPGKQRQTYTLVSHMTFMDWVTLIGFALAAIGISMVTLGAATPGVVAVGSVLLATGAIAGATGAVVDTVQAYNKGRLTGTRLALNALQFVASVATAGSCGIMTRAAIAGSGALRLLGTNARYILLTRIAAGADVVQLAIMTVDVAQQLSRLQGDPNAGTIAAMMLGQLLIQGTLTIVNARNAFGELGSHPRINLDAAESGEFVVREPVTRPGPAVLDEAPVGATHGTDVHPLTNVRNVGTATLGGLGPNDMDRILVRLARTPRAGGATLTRVDIDHFTMTAGGQTVEIRFARTETLPPATVHQPTGGGPSNAGPARLEMAPPATAGGQWTAKVTLDNRLPNANAEIVLGDELDEISGILRSGARTQAEIATQMDNSLFRRGAAANPPITADDRSTAGQLFDIHAKLRQAIRERALERAAGRNTSRLDQLIKSHQDSLTALTNWMALDEDANMDLKIRVLRQAATDPGALQRVPQANQAEVLEQWDEFLRQLRMGPSATALAAHGGMFGAGGVGPTAFNEQSLAHLMYPEPHAPVPKSAPGQFRDNGVSGGHWDQALMDFQNNHPEYGYYFHMEGSETDGATTYRRYTQYMWNGPGNAPAPGTTGHPSTGTVGRDWVRSVQPKTTTSNIEEFVGDSERALWQWVRHPSRQPTYFGAGATAATSAEFSQKLPGGPRITGFFDFNPAATGSARFQIRTAFIDASWIP